MYAPEVIVHRIDKRDFVWIWEQLEPCTMITLTNSQLCQFPKTQRQPTDRLLGSSIALRFQVHSFPEHLL